MFYKQFRRVHAAVLASLGTVFGVVGVGFAQPVLITGNTIIGPTDVSITPTAGGAAVPLVTAQITVAGSGVLTVNGRHTIASLALSDSSRVIHQPAFSFDYGNEVVQGLKLTVTGNVSVTSSTTIDASGRGYGSSEGPGAGADATGGSYGGGGGHGGTGSMYSPGNPGGQPYGSFTQPTTMGSGGGISFGSSPGGAGGGALRLDVGGTLTVDGTIRANGSSGNTGGAGGSIWITAGAISGSGQLSADGGTGASYGSGGRIAVYAPTCSISVENMTAIGSGAAAPGTLYLQINGTAPVLIFDDNDAIGSEAQRVSPTAGLSVTAADVLVRQASLGFSSVNIAQDLTIDVGSSIDVSGRGHGSSEGPGAGADATGGSYGGGGGHGGTGSMYSPGNPGGQPYGSFTQPTTMGSGGGISFGSSPGGAGGGALRLDVGGTLTVDGTIRANGSSGNTGGAGGSIWITAGAISGSGQLSADGGIGASYGSGGRIAAYAPTFSLNVDNMTAIGSGAAAPGTLYLDVNGAVPVLIFDDNNTSGSETQRVASTIGLSVPAANVIVRQATVDFASVDTLQNLTIESAASIDVSGRGFASSEGPGAGADATGGNYGGGGGHGGAGSTYSPGNPGGQPYGSSTQPTTMGSGGGTSFGSLPGGAGGGALRLDVGGTLTVDGAIRSNGASGNTGGAGGSIWITANTIVGSGQVNADGGAGASHGGGGRIAIYSCFNSVPNANVRAEGSGPAEDGTVYISTAGAEILPLVDSICGGGQANFAVRAGGVGEITFQWRRNGSPLVDGTQASGAVVLGSTTETLQITGFTLAEIGDYDVEVTAQCGTAISNPVTAQFCLADVDCDQDSDSDDVINFFAAWENAESAADLDYDGDADSDDILVFFAIFEAGC